MRTAVDSSVLLDVIIDDRAFAERSEVALRKAAGEGSLIIGECALAEIRPALRPGEVERLLEDLQIDFAPSTRESALLAGEMFQAYLVRRRRARRAPARVLPDFLVGAHAQILADRLLARDRGYYRDYFRTLRLVEPT